MTVLSRVFVFLTLLIIFSPKAFACDKTIKSIEMAISSMDSEKLKQIYQNIEESEYCSKTKLNEIGREDWVDLLFVGKKLYESEQYMRSYIALTHAISAANDQETRYTSPSPEVIEELLFYMKASALLALQVQHDLSENNTKLNKKELY